MKRHSIELFCFFFGLAFTGCNGVTEQESSPSAGPLPSVTEAAPSSETGQSTPADPPSLPSDGSQDQLKCVRHRIAKEYGDNYRALAIDIAKATLACKTSEQVVMSVVRPSSQQESIQ